MQNVNSMSHQMNHNFILIEIVEILMKFDEIQTKLRCGNLLKLKFNCEMRCECAHCAT